MNKRWINISTIVLMVILVVLVVLIGLNFTELRKEMQSQSANKLDNPPNYHYMVIVDGSDSGSVNELKKGLDGASEDFGVIYELWSFSDDDRNNQIKRQMDIGIESDVDGIFIQASYDPDFSALFNKAKLRNIPVITLGNELPSAEKLSFITYNRYQMGSYIGKMLNEHLASKYIDDGTVILLQNSNLVDQDQALAMQDAMYQGYVVKPIRVDFNGEIILNSEDVAKEILRENEDLRAIICLSTAETLGVIEAIKDMNKVNDVVVIGSGDSEEVIDYVSRGVLYATIVPDHARIGYEALLDLTKHHEGNFVSQYRDINVRVITDKDLEAYLSMKEGLSDE